ncbi:hypothetical protein A3I18_00050 [Candidatus Campbellbacteria bacterium RIFCSPLOWO2_02_FULL_35_11]|uniref:HTH deoR-type domain-containing protein n=2 Tax=Candidatus Campbelliibacteriota TaxID=1752727 RepID=A0A1F5ELJ0_9BACT|nr:MAG: hypothetical protein A3E89_00430 [Candidatus Campbellbacteria bacterium RIFCSPHIGHO2_12_FULL_35_10]OGD70889.1 MAG: hypothetical protein A3I18_00050 [Candidatus Campbellbacteria bacterium RIFCSPLOWO2_02_FULL_35_11]
MTNLKDITKNESLSLSEQGLSSAQGKLEKITMAIYLVTDFFPNGEPLKYHLRDKCVSLMSFIMSFNNSQESFTKIYSLSSEINSLLKLSASSKLVSEMNYSILVNEYGKFLKMIKDSEPERNMLSRNFFKAEESISEVTTKDKIYKGQYKGQKDKSFVNVLDKNTRNENVDTEINNVLYAKKSSSQNKTGNEKVGRKEMILKIIKDKKDLPDGQAGVTIKDIIDVIKNCSEKTIQRELISMVNDGVLKKEGERRWSRYSIF